ncbi:MurR/RpiR family transcriptional regulator [Aquibacillus sp. 3ASR75-11]|uniref:MurR/RpiR family transcriptional regulator n=2 Tax=Terrihalobacillus insolitus TaxID=2950438 RepID=A0A9X3WRQ0_9BACI|nr:MurR/RpiR family transcriptional regulator [Terrihalobacillus insolitus]MDC3414050.1 MurR/RpiR family transcriptional regulator [Terrihalobacillus insolitus]MDC3424140.1 MurR/RpiR family transcriptional regulator [Terrihalobacillus insolitus]
MLKEILQNIPPSERKIAEFIISNPKAAVGCTASELGELSSTSSAAVIRLCKSLGLKGFQELKLRIAGDIPNSFNGRYQDIVPNESRESIVNKMTNNSLQAITETANIINYQTLEHTVDVILKTEKIHFFGVGASGVIAQDAQQKFIRINKPASAFMDIHVAATYIANVTPNDVVMGISFSGETMEVVKILELAKQKGATTISLTSYGSTSVSEIADIPLYISASQEATFRSGATSSRLAQLHMIDILFMCVVTEQYDETMRNLEKTKNAVDFIIGKTK